MAFLNPFLFSTKYYDWETSLYYFGHRYYNASTGRWLSRDPLGEQFGQNPYALLGNDAVDSIDLLGTSDFNRPPVSIFPDRPGNPTVTYGPASANPTYGNADFAYYAMSIDVTIAVGAHATYEGVLRGAYDAAVTKLQRSFRTLAAEGYLTDEEAARRFVQARNDLTRATRRSSGAFARTVAAAVKPEKAFKTYELLRQSKTPTQILATGGARPAANAAGKVLRAGGSVCAVAGITLSVVDIASAPPGQRARTAASHAGGTVGALSFGYAGGQIGALGGPWGAGIGFISGTVVGSFAGSKAGENYYDALIDQ